MATAASRVLIDNGFAWTDTNGEVIKAQGGSIIRSGSLYHWFGPAFGGYKDYSFYAINHYTSPDLKNWTKLSPALAPGMPGIPFTQSSWIGRPWVMWNPNTSLFVMVIEWTGPGGNAAVRNRYAFLTAASINGPWTYQSSKLISNLTDSNNVSYPLGDLGVYSEGGEAWLLYTFDKPQPNYSQAILKLGSDFMTPLPHTTAGSYVEFTGGTWRPGVQEAAGVIKKGTTYYYFTSLCNGWKSSETRYRTAPSMAGPWTANAIVPTSPASANSFNTQHDFVLPIVGTNSTTYVYVGDRWSNFTNDTTTTSRNAWYPLTFSATGVPVINAPDYSANGGDWELDAVAGTWSIPYVNKLQNPGFESSWTGWTYSGNASIATAATEVYAGTKALKAWSSSPYTSAIRNASATNCLAGTYQASVWTRAGGTFNQRVFQVYINGVFLKEISLPASTSWTRYVINDFAVPAGATVTLGIALNANGGAWTQFDEFDLVRN